MEVIRYTKEDLLQHFKEGELDSSAFNEGMVELIPVIIKETDQPWNLSNPDPVDFEQMDKDLIELKKSGSHRGKRGGKRGGFNNFREQHRSKKGDNAKKEQA